MKKKNILYLIIGTLVLAFLVSAQLNYHIIAGEDDHVEWDSMRVGK